VNKIDFKGKVGVGGADCRRLIFWELSWWLGYRRAYCTEGRWGCKRGSRSKTARRGNVVVMTREISALHGAFDTGFNRGITRGHCMNVVE
jgi:hypothetical protein